MAIRRAVSRVKRREKSTYPDASNDGSEWRSDPAKHPETYNARAEYRYLIGRVEASKEAHEAILRAYRGQNWLYRWITAPGFLNAAGEVSMMGDEDLRRAEQIARDHPGATLR